MPFDVSPLMLLAAVGGASGGSRGPDRRALAGPRGRLDPGDRLADAVVGRRRGVLALCALLARFPVPSELAVFGAAVSSLQLLLATDLDQRLLPDLITLPTIPIAFAVRGPGLDPLVPAGDLPPAIGRRARVPGDSLRRSPIPFGAGAIGMGDIKLLVSSGLLLRPGADRVGRRAAARCWAWWWILLLLARRGGSR